MADEQEEVFSPDVHFEPIVKLPLVETKTMEEDEEVLFQMRSKLFRYDSENAEWKERGTGEMKLLRHNDDGSIRILMRREKTLKICANHFLYPYMELKPSSTTDRAWIWSTLADFADEEPKPELLAIRFGNTENAQKFKSAFEYAKKLLTRSRLGFEEEDDDDDEDDSTKDDDDKENKDESTKEDDDKENKDESTKEDDDKDREDSKKENTEPENLTAKLEELSVKETDETSPKDSITASAST